MADPRTRRTLEFDGGGMRGYLSACFFKLFVNAMNIPPADVWKYFDVICGTSIGGIIALATAFGLTPDELLPFFTVDGPWIFTVRNASDVALGSNNASTPSNIPNTVQKIAILFGNDQFYNSVSLSSNYGSSRMQTSLVNTFGTAPLSELKTSVVITAHDKVNKAFKLYSNADYAEFSGQNAKISDVARYTSAAPLYLPPFDGKIDGGVYQNNPVAHGKALAAAKKPTANRDCVLSIGTGLGDLGFDSATMTLFRNFANIVANQPLADTYEQIDEELNAVNTEENAITSTKLLASNIMVSLDAGTPFEDTVTSLVALLDTAMTGAQESAAAAIDFEAKYTRNRLFTYRFQPALDPALDTELDNSTPEILTYYENLATATFNAQSAEINEFISRMQL